MRFLFYNKAMSENFQMVAKTLFGFEELLASELKNMGAANVVKGMRMVSFEGDTGFMYKANLACRTAMKILKPVHTFSVRNEHAFYNAVREIDWTALLGKDQTLAIDSTVNSELFTHSQYIVHKTKDAIVDQFREKYGIRPSVDTDNPDLRINVHIRYDQCSIALDSSGRPLNQRGYRKLTNEAPINEVLAAGLLILSGWTGESHFLDPMCGSGTIPVEAAMIATNLPANINRESFAFQKWKDYDAALYETIRKSLLAKVKPLNYTITGFDKDPAAVAKALDNIQRAGLSKQIVIREDNFFKAAKSVDGPLHILFNPPYDERISVDTEMFYAAIGDTLKQKYKGTTAWLMTANLEALKFVGLKASRRIEVTNGQLEARLVKYELYEGSRRTNFKNRE